MSSNRMEVADCCTTIIRPSYDNKSDYLRSAMIDRRSMIAATIVR